MTIAPKISKVIDVYDKYFKSRIQYTYEEYPGFFSYKPHLYYSMLGVPPRLLRGPLDGVDDCLKRIDSNSDVKKLQNEDEAGWLQHVTSLSRKTRVEEFSMMLASSLYFKKQTILVDAGQTGISEYFKATSDQGVADVINGSARVEECLIRHKQKNGSTICLLPQGSETINYSPDAIRVFCEALRSLELPVIINTPSMDENRDAVRLFSQHTSNTYGLFLFDTVLGDVERFRDELEDNSIDYLLVASRVPHHLHPQYEHLIPGLYDKLLPTINAGRLRLN